MSGLGPEAQRALAMIRRMVADAPTQLGEGVARVVREAPGERLEQLMRTPARRAILEGIFRQMPQRLDSERAAGVSSSMRWCITGRPDGVVDVYRLQIVDSQCHVTRGSAIGVDEARVTVTLDGVELLKLATGNSDPMRAYFSGRIKLAGDVVLAAKLASLFQMPSASR
ncbi:MAG: SCP2 sterol-binding domain-containing protein [Actinomycetota bacterium]|nr:SCP2 sterol-binding domain-containing protein [Actinomycetota bacterium]